MSSTISPNMNLVIPGVGTELGPTWAQDLNADLSILDSHNHSVGQGVQIQPNGLNINTDLPFNSNNATLLRSTIFSPQSAVLTQPTDIGSVYVVNNELYYNDVTGGHHVQITNNGSVNAGAGSITGLPSGTASASFSGGTFTWQSATATAANMDAGSYIFRNATANSKGLTLAPPSAMAADYSLTLPALPSSQSFMTVDTSGNMSGYASINQGIVRTNLAPVGQQISATQISFTSTAFADTAVPNLTVTITTSGRPVMIFCQGIGGGGGAFQSANVTSNGNATFKIKRSDIGFISGYNIPSPGGDFPPSSVMYLDTPSAGTYTYSIWISVSPDGDATASVFNMALVAYEL